MTVEALETCRTGTSGARRPRVTLLAPRAAAVLVLGVAVPVTGTAADATTFAGTLDVTRFVNSRGRLLAAGALTGTLTDATGPVIGTVTGLPVRVPVTQAAGTCRILHLDLGPLDLTPLGLRVHLDEVVLDITAQQGGGLLGNPLRAVAKRLDGGARPGSLAGPLNRILAAL
jgi:hypothetical protein